MDSNTPMVMKETKNRIRVDYEGVTIEDDTAAIYVDVYRPEDVEYKVEPYGTLCIYYNQLEWLEYRLSSADKKALGTGILC